MILNKERGKQYLFVMIQSLIYRKINSSYHFSKCFYTCFTFLFHNWLSLNWTGALKLSLLLRIPPRKLEF